MAKIADLGNTSYLIVSKNKGTQDYEITRSWMAVNVLINMLTCCWFFFQPGALSANIRHDPRSEHNQQISERSERQRSWGVWACSETPVEVLVGEAP